MTFLFISFFFFLSLISSPFFTQSLRGKWKRETERAGERDSEIDSANDDRAGVRRVTAREVELVIDQLSEMEEIRPTHPRQPVFGLISVRFFFSFFPFFPRSSFLLLLFFFFVLFFTQREMEEGDGRGRPIEDRSEIDDEVGVRRITAGEVEIQIERFSGMEEIRPTHAYWPDFEFDFGFLLFWFDDFRQVVEWATGFMVGEFVFFFFFSSGFISGDFLLFWFYFWRLVVVVVLVFSGFISHFGFLYFWFDGFESGDWVIAGPGWIYAGLGEEKSPAWPDVRRIGRRKKKKYNRNFCFLFLFFFFLKKRTKMLVTCLSLHATRIAKKMKFQLATWSGTWLNATWLNSRIYIKGDMAKIAFSHNWIHCV